MFYTEILHEKLCLLTIKTVVTEIKKALPTNTAMMMQE